MSVFAIVICAGSLSNFLELIGLVIVFILILFATYYTTRFVGKHTGIQTYAQNVEVIETFRLSQTKYIQIVRIGKEKYFALAVCKDSVTVLSEIDKDDLEFVDKSEISYKNFTEVLKGITSKKNK